MKQRRDDSWDQVDPFIGKLVNDPEIAQHQRQTNRVGLLLVAVSGVLLALFLAADSLWGSAFPSFFDDVAFIGGTTMVIIVMTFFVLGVHQKRE